MTLNTASVEWKNNTNSTKKDQNYATYWEGIVECNLG
jgi:hypothetical protein